MTPSPGLAAQRLALLAYVELSAYLHTSADADMAPRLSDSLLAAQIAQCHYQRYTIVAGHLVADGFDPAVLMRGPALLLSSYATKTTPKDWPEALTKMVIRAGLVDDFLGLPHPSLPDGLCEKLLECSDFSEAIQRLGELVASGATLDDRLSLWGRRYVGECLSVVGGAAAAYPEWLNESYDDPDESETSNDAEPVSAPWRAYTAVTDAVLASHSARLTALGLSA